MNTKLALVALVVAICGPAVAVVADTLKLKDSVVQDVVIVDAGDKELVYEKAGKRSSVPLASIELIEWDAHVNFNLGEQQYRKGSIGTAMISYDQAMHYASRDWEKRVISARRAMVKASIAQPASLSCPKCGQTGLSACAACRGSGRLACDACSGAGAVVCPRCQGRWQDKKCSTCDGAGKTYSAKDRGISIVAPKACPDCAGKGWRFVCPACAATEHHGTAVCTACRGEGNVGECRACSGRKVDCPACSATNTASIDAGGLLTWQNLAIVGGGVALVLVVVGIVVARAGRARR
jgi:DnaJ-class molecular chaperone